MSALPAPRIDQTPGPQAGLGAAAERYARLTLRKSAQTQATYMSTYRRFVGWLADHTGHPDPPSAALTADVVAAYVTELEARRAPVTVKKERAAINRLARYLHTLGAIDATEIVMIEGSRAGAQPRRRDALDAVTWKRVKDVARARLHQGPRGRTTLASKWVTGSRPRRRCQGERRTAERCAVAAGGGIGRSAPRRSAL